jgi:hypothetical protein
MENCGLLAGPGLPDGIFSNQKSKIWVNFRGPWNGKGWYSLGQFETYYGYFVYFVTNLVAISPILLYCVMKNLATLNCNRL